MDRREVPWLGIDIARICRLFGWAPLKWSGKALTQPHRIMEDSEDIMKVCDVPNVNEAHKISSENQ